MSRSADGLGGVEPPSEVRQKDAWLPTEVESGGTKSARLVGTERRLLLAIAQVTERERLLQAAEELAQLGSWTWTVGSDAVVWSDQVHRIFGTDPAGPPADYPFYLAMIHPGDRERVLEVIRAAVQSGDVYEVDHRIVRRDGRVVEVRGRGRAELDAAGRPARLIGGIQDITDMKAAERELQRSRDLFAGVLDAATEQSIIATDPQGLITVFNAGAERMLGYRAHEMIGRSPECLHDRHEIAMRAAELGVAADFGVFLVHAAAGEPETRQWTYVTRDGRRLVASISVTAMHGSQGEVTGFIKVGTDITPLQRSRDLFAGVLDAATEQSIIATDPQGLITVFNTGAERMLGYRAEEMIGRSPECLHDRHEIEARAASLGVAADFGVFLVHAAAGRPETRQWTYVTRDGRRLLASISVTAMHGSQGEVTGFIKVGTDITQRVQAQAALQESEQRFRNLFRYAPNGMMLFGIGSDNLGRFLQVNPAMARLTGYSVEQLHSMTMADLVSPDDLAAFKKRLAAFHLNPVLNSPAERHWIHADGHDLWVQLNVSPSATNADGDYVVGQVEDITARKAAEAKLRHQALHDGLTGLPNRLLLMDRIEHALAFTARNNSLVGVLYLDLDGFKAVNDSAGHAVGDLALVHVANRISVALRPSDTVARLGGDEFVIVCEGLQSSDQAAAVARRVLAAISTPFNHQALSFSLTCSMGISLSNGSSSPDDLLRRADQAMYEAKRAGKATMQLA